MSSFGGELEEGPEQQESSRYDRTHCCFQTQHLLKGLSEVIARERKGRTTQAGPSYSINHCEKYMHSLKKRQTEVLP